MCYMYILYIYFVYILHICYIISEKTSIIWHKSLVDFSSSSRFSSLMTHLEFAIVQGKFSFILIVERSNYSIRMVVLGSVNHGRIYLCVHPRPLQPHVPGLVLRRWSAQQWRDQDLQPQTSPMTSMWSEEESQIVFSMSDDAHSPSSILQTWAANSALCILIIHSGDPFPALQLELFPLDAMIFSSFIWSNDILLVHLIQWHSPCSFDPMTSSSLMSDSPSMQLNLLYSAPEHPSTCLLHSSYVLYTPLFIPLASV